MFLPARTWIPLLPLISLMACAGCAETESIPAAPKEKPALTVAPPKGEPGDIPERAYQLRELERVDVKVAGHVFHAWFVDTDPKREEGMMWVRDTDVKADEGMIFVFPNSEKRSFWMRNCRMGLDIAYFGPDKKLLNVAEGKPGVEDGLPSTGPAKYVLEVKPGTFKRLGIRPGAVLEVPESVMAVR